jgi:hypothetical protein
MENNNWTISGNTHIDPATNSLALKISSLLFLKVQDIGKGDGGSQFYSS